MKAPIVIIIVIIAVIGVLIVFRTVNDSKQLTSLETYQSNEKTLMNVSSIDFQNEEMMDSRFTCDGEDLLPHLAWSGAPEGTKSFAITVLDPDAPGGMFVHWLVANIPANVNEIPQGGPAPTESTQVVNGFGKITYGGPCPPSGVHRYFFTVYALDAERIDGLSTDNFVKKVEEHALAKGEIMGKYKRQK